MFYSITCCSKNIFCLIFNVVIERIVLVKFIRIIKNIGPIEAFIPLPFPKNYKRNVIMSKGKPSSISQTGVLKVYFIDANLPSTTLFLILVIILLFISTFLPSYIPSRAAKFFYFRFVLNVFIRFIRISSIMTI